MVIVIPPHAHWLIRAWRYPRRSDASEKDDEIAPLHGASEGNARQPITTLAPWQRTVSENCHFGPP
jgi:hypothetical protein